MSENDIKPVAFDGSELRHGCVLHPKRWSGDTHGDIGGSVDEDATDTLMAAAADEIDRLKAERDAAVADAERYRWLRDRKFSFSHDQEWRGISGSRWGNWPYDTDEGHSSVMDKAIDAAMKEQEQGK